MGGRWKTALLAVVPAALIAFGAPGSAGAAPAAKANAGSVSATAAPRVTAAAERAGDRAITGREATLEEELAAFWNGDRMRTATPADSAPGLQDAEAEHQDGAADAEQDAREDAEDGAQPKPAGPAGQIDPGKPRPASPALRRTTSSTARAAAVYPGYPYNSFQARTAGKVFFTNTSDGRNYVCSGTIINSEGKNSVWTAGHCVHGGQGRNWHANWVFVPSYSNGWAPYGQWTARQLWSKAGWISSSEWASDMGVAIMNPRNGWRIVDYLGGQGITWNQSKRIYVTAFGYPAAYPFNGQWLYTCSGVTFPEWEFLGWSAETLGLRCDMTGGSSGGGWLAFFNGTTGYLNGNNSFKYNNDPNTMYSPYYDDTASSLYGTTRFL